MARIKIIDTIDLSHKGLRGQQKNGNKICIALHQGSIDGACAVYSTIIALLIQGEINKEDVQTNNGSVDKRSPRGQFLSALLEQRGMNLGGWYFKPLSQEINKAGFSIKSTAVQKNFIQRLYDTICLNYPAILGFSYDDSDESHAIVCVGIEESDSADNCPQKLFCIDPIYDVSPTSYYNCIIELPRKIEDGCKCTYFTDKDESKVVIHSLIVFDKIL